jgi:hypothetical protein
MLWRDVKVIIHGFKIPLSRLPIFRLSIRTTDFRLLAAARKFFRDLARKLGIGDDTKEHLITMWASMVENSCV